MGEMPYGVLPVTHRPRTLPGATHFHHKVEDFLRPAFDFWRNSKAPALDPDATDSVPSGGGATSVVIASEVMASVPHPFNLQLRRAVRNDDRGRWTTLLEYFHDNLIGFNIANTWVYTRRPSVEIFPPGSDAISINTQYDLMDNQWRSEILAYAPAGTDPGEATDLLNVLDDDVLPLLYTRWRVYEFAPEFLRNLWIEHAGFGSLDSLLAADYTYDTHAEPVHDVVAVNGNLVDVQNRIETYINNLNGYIAGTMTVDRERALVAQSHSLLIHILDHAYQYENDLQKLVDTLTVVKATTERQDLPDVIAHVDRLLREAISVNTLRIDAWLTSIANRKLAAMRQEQSHGIHLGGYGWLVDLEPSDTDKPTQGFLHTPSLSHATTAAVLRAGWSAFGTGDQASPLAVNLSGDRVLGGQWILDAVRNGQDIGELLGARFERWLHDEHADVHIETVRSEALAAVGRNGEPPTQIVDGLLLARATLDHDLTPHEFAMKSALGGMAAVVQEKAALLANDLDAVADLLMTQSIHSLAQGNNETAAAAMAAMGGGDGGVPKVEATQTRQAAQLMRVRVIATWNPPSPSPPATEVLRSANPGLWNWLLQQLPPASGVFFEQSILDDDGSVISTQILSLSQTPLPIGQAAFMTSAEATQQGSRLGKAIRALAAQTAGVPVAQVVLNTGVAGNFNIDEFGIMAACLVDALGRARGLQDEDLKAPGDQSVQTNPDLQDLAN
ncbi:MAG: hypothetical protein AAGA48_04495, partial [Myxococcota bacterium]